MPSLFESHVFQMLKQGSELTGEEELMDTEPVYLETMWGRDLRGGVKKPARSTWMLIYAGVLVG